MQVEELAETFEMLGDWEERYRYLIELGRKLPPLPEAEHNEANKVRGCMSQVWMTARTEPGPPLKLHFAGDSDAHIVKGLIAVLFMLCSDRTPREILDTDINSAFARLGLDSNLSMNRRNGFYSMVERIKLLATQAVNETA
ncbi:SufE family protein [Nevskia soli]|uniref:SufE family protein n=1 Tax=Nevskia soli TaxID=418856 RepID=UPI0004A6FDB7|nr:SufE family protein [Nevskia soli]